MPDGVPVEYPVQVEWEGGMRWRGGPANGPALLVDGERQAAPSPVDALVVSIASCSAIDVVDYLEKRRTPPSSASVSVRFSRAAEHPRRLTDLHLAYRVATDSPREHVERAVQLSFDKYCSVAASLAPDIRFGWEIEVSPAAGE
ncbi:MAG: OsmC family protein [Gemmatimonadetes bacterium]|nr:OsmC family protein [Gemmatimonadota bacterium]